jgi:hypothetical protein
MKRNVLVAGLASGAVLLTIASAMMGQMLDPSGSATPGATPGSAVSAPLSNNFAAMFSDPAFQKKLQQRLQERLVARQKEKSGAAAGSAAPPESVGNFKGSPEEADEAKLPIMATDFVPGPQRIVPETMAARMAHGSSARQAELVALFNQVLDAIEPQTRSNNVAAALAFAIAASEQVKDGSGVLKPGRFAELVRQINQDVGDSEEFKALSDRRKQEIYESSLLTAGLIVSAFRRASAAKDPTLERQAKEAAADYLRQMNGVQP